MDDKTRTFFPRQDENLSKEESIERSTRDLLLWVADQAEQSGDTINAERLRKEAAKCKCSE